MDRMTRLLGTTDHAQQIIELGAGYSPVAPKSAGWRTHVVDHATRGELRAKYADAGVDLEVIEDVDTIWRGGPLHEVVPERLLGQVDRIIASHVLEHIPDLIGFLQSASRLVRPGGKLSIALPDRRYCFDCFRPWTTTGDLLESNGVDLRRHTLKTAYNHMAYSAVVDGQLAWGPWPVKSPALMDPFAPAITIAKHYRAEAESTYHDYHAWQFTPAGFRLIMLELGAIGLTDWRVEQLTGPESFEFFVTLGRPAGDVAPVETNSLQTQRRDLLLLQLAEAREQIDFILGASNPGTGRPDADDGPYGELIARLADQDRRLQEIAETLRWLRALLNPVRNVWRRVQRRG